MKFDRNNKNELVKYYEHILMKNAWSMGGIPFDIGDWYLLVGIGPSSLEYPLNYAAIYVDEQEGELPVYIYVEVTEDQVMKLIVGISLEELQPELPVRALRAVNCIFGNHYN
jgi:hypothetical protein